MGLFTTIFNLFQNKKEETPNVSVPDPTPIEFPSNKKSAKIPPRNLSSPSGSEFVKNIWNIGPGEERENLIYQEVLNGNVPDFMRTMVEITIQSAGNILKYSVLPDCLCIGNDDDFVRVPLNPLTAQKIGDLFDCSLPTSKIADQIWKVAPTKLTPIPGGPPYDLSMRSVKKFSEHNQKIEQARAGKSGLITGHKKDVVISNKLFNYPHNVAIYGWFYLSGKPIQDLNPKDHNNLYEDYSHGIRYVFRPMNLNGEIWDYYAILNSSFAFLISNEGQYDASSLYKK